MTLKYVTNETQAIKIIVLYKLLQMAQFQVKHRDVVLSFCGNFDFNDHITEICCTA